MTNVLKNAVEAIESRAKVAPADYRGRIAVTMGQDDTSVFVTVADNGIGLPHDRDRIVEPYAEVQQAGRRLA